MNQAIREALMHTSAKLSDEEIREIADKLFLETITSKRMTAEQLRGKAEIWQTEQGMLDQAKWIREPVPIREFIESPTFLNEQGTWPLLMSDLEKINDGLHTEAVFTGPIGAGKTTGAVLTLIYQTYIISCMRDPHEFLGQNPKHEIVMILQALTKEGAKEIGYTRMRNTIAVSPYFKQYFMFDDRIESQMRFPRNVVIRPVAGHETAAIGQNVIGGLLDEINFMKVIKTSTKSRDGEAFDQAKKNYNTIAMRRTSRFMKKGWVPGMLCLVSSRNYPGQFTDEKEAEAITNKRIFIYDRKVWELKPQDFNPETFSLYVGSDTEMPRILTDITKLGLERSKIIDVPTDLKQFFERDIMGALRDLAGVAPSSAHPYILNKELLIKAFNKTPSILTRQSCDFKQTKVEYWPDRKKDIKRDRWVHYDAGLTNDHGGLAMGYVSHFVSMKRASDIEILPHVVFDFVLDIAPPINGEISFENVRKLIYKLRAAGWPIKFISMDSYQSRDSLQVLYSNGFKVGIRSMDDDTWPYDIAKQAIYDERVKLPEHDKALIELSRIEVNVKKKKIDHPPNGSKDCADAIAGVITGLTMQREIWRDHNISMQSTPRVIAELIAATIREKNSVDNRTRREDANV